MIASVWEMCWCFGLYKEEEFEDVIGIFIVILRVINGCFSGFPTSVKRSPHGVSMVGLWRNSLVT